jgi:hypothetical protein
MLAQVRADSPDGEPASPREVLASPVGEQRAAELISEAAIVVDSAGTARAPPPAAKPATAPWQKSPMVDTGQDLAERARFDPKSRRKCEARLGPLPVIPVSPVSSPAVWGS